MLYPSAPLANLFHDRIARRTRRRFLYRCAAPSLPALGHALLAWHGFLHVDEAPAGQPFRVRADPILDGRHRHDRQPAQFVCERVSMAIVQPCHSPHETEGAAAVRARPLAKRYHVVARAAYARPTTHLPNYVRMPGAASFLMDGEV